MTGLRNLFTGGLAALILASGQLAGAGAASGAIHRPVTSAYSVTLPVGARLQWNENFGYCGEVSLISAGLYYGQYLSQYDARGIASNYAPQYKARSQLLVGVNDTQAAQAARLGSAEWSAPGGSSAPSFLAWVKGQVLKGHPVAIGVYTNEYRFYGSTNPNAGDASYDHIVIVTGIGSNHPLTLPATYYPDDTITFSDHGLWTGTASGAPQYFFIYPFASFQASRSQANAPTAAPYSLADVKPDYGIGFTGVADPSSETLPVSVTTSVNYESPEIVDGSNTRPAAMPLTLTATVSGLTAGSTYNLYRYDVLANVPTGTFNAKAASAAQTIRFTAIASTYTVSRTIQSNNEVIYRAVPASAP